MGFLSYPSYQLGPRQKNFARRCPYAGGGYGFGPGVIDVAHWGIESSSEVLYTWIVPVDGVRNPWMCNQWAVGVTTVVVQGEGRDTAMAWQAGN